MIEGKIKITLSEDQMELIQKHVDIYIINNTIEKEISSAILSKYSYTINLTPEDIEELVGTVSFVANHEETNALLVEELDDLAEHLESYLDAL